MKEAPEYIYLQMVEGEDNHEATWCQHRVEDTDIQYARVREEQQPKAWLIEHRDKVLCKNVDCIVRGPHWHPDEQPSNKSETENG